MLVIKGLSISYQKKEALSDISLKIEKGKIVGLLGPSGSGKTTLMDVIAGLLYYDVGEVQIDGHSPSTKTKSMVSLLTENNEIPRWMCVKDIIDFYKGMYLDFNVDTFHRMLESIGIEAPLSKSVHHLSKGTIQLLRLALALSREADLYLLDEPLGGMDTMIREKVIELLLDYMTPDATMLISSHIIPEIEQLIERVIFIKEGQLVGDYDCEALRAETGQSIEKTFKEVMR